MDDEKHTAVRACMKRGILASSLGTRLIEASLLSQVYRQAGIAEGSMRGGRMDLVEWMRKHKQQEVIGRSCCTSDYVVAAEEPGLGVDCRSYWSSLTWVRFEEEASFGQEHSRLNNSGIRP